MKYLSVCSGIEAATVAWQPLGWQAVALSEIDPFCCDLLAHHYPNVPNMGDMTKYKEWKIDEPVDVIIGGTPCQSFSVAGLRKGLADPRGNLALVFLGIVERFAPEWVIWENVPGVLSDKGNAFGNFASALSDIGYACGWRVLDAKYFGVPQKRRRVFVVGHSGDWRSAAAVLFDSGCLRGRVASSGEKRERSSACVAPCVSGGAPFNRTGNERVELEAYLPVTQYGEIAGSVTARHDSSPCVDRRMNMLVEPFAFGWQKTELPIGDVSQSIDCDTVPAVCLPQKKGPKAAWGIPGNWIGRKPENGGNSTAFMENLSPSLTTMDRHGIVYHDNIQWRVRRFTPREVERLQGFPDDYTLIPRKKGKLAADAPRYAALGNSIAVPVLKWLGKRIDIIDGMEVD